MRDARLIQLARKYAKTNPMFRSLVDRKALATIIEPQVDRDVQDQLWSQYLEECHKLSATA